MSHIVQGWSSSRTHICVITPIVGPDDGDELVKVRSACASSLIHGAGRSRKVGDKARDVGWPGTVRILVLGHAVEGKSGMIEPDEVAALKLRGG